MKYINVALEEVIVHNNRQEDQGNVLLGTEFFYNNLEFLKVLNPNSHKIKSEVERQIGLTFPITVQEFDSLDDQVKGFIRKQGYGVSTEEIRYRYFHYKDCIKYDLKCIIPIKVDNQVIVDVDINKLNFPSDLLGYIKNGKALVIIYQDSEGFFFNHQHVKWFNDFAAKFRLNPDSFIVESANLKWPEITKGYYLTNNEFTHRDTIKYTAKVNSNFMERLWFTNIPIHNILDRGHHYTKFSQFLFNKIKKRHSKKLLCLQRRLSDIRTVIFYKLHTNQHLAKDSLYSLLNPYKSNLDEIKLGLRRLKLRDSEQICEWYEKHFDINKGFSLDRSDQDINWATELNEDLHNNTFVNVVIETHQFPSSELFLSEKTFRSIYAAQPFIIFGNPETLKYLKKYGYKTFSKFWDESYDEDVSIQERIDRLISTLEFITSKSLDELNEWLPELQPILEHNFNILMSSKTVHKRNKELTEWIEH